MFYSSFVESILTFAIICWFGRLESAVKKSQNINGFDLDELLSYYCIYFSLLLNVVYKFESVNSCCKSNCPWGTIKISINQLTQQLSINQVSRK